MRQLIQLQFSCLSNPAVACCVICARLRLFGGACSQAAEKKARAADDQGAELLTLILTLKCAPLSSIQPSVKNNAAI